MEQETKRQYCFDVILRLLAIFGVPIEPLNLSFFSKLVYGVYCIIFLIVFPVGYVVSQIMQIPRVSDNLKLVSFIMCYVFSDSLGLVKMAMAYKKRHQIRKMCRVFKTGNMTPNANRGGEIEFVYVDKANRDVLMQVFYFQLFVFILLVYRVIFTKAQIEEYRKQVGTNLFENASFKEVPLPFGSYIPFYHEDGMAYYVAAFFQLFSAWVFGLYICCIDAILCGYVVHSNAQLLILRNYIKLFVEKSEERFLEHSGLSSSAKDDIIASFRIHTYGLKKFPPEIQRYAKEIIKEYIVHHLKVFDLCTTVENEFSILVLLQFISSGGMICFVLYQIYATKPGGSDFMSSVAFMSIIMYQLYRYCVSGTNLSDYSVSVSDSIYEINWMVVDTSIQKSFALMMQRAQKPIKLTAAKFVFLSLQTFTALLKTSFSCFMFMRTMNE